MSNLVYTDIVTRQKFENSMMRIVQALIEGHVIESRGTEYRYAHKGQELYSTVDKENPEKETIFVASQSGVFIKYLKNVLDSGCGFSWMIYSNNVVSFAESIYKKMSQEEIAIAIGNLSLDHINQDKLRDT